MKLPEATAGSGGDEDPLAISRRLLASLSAAAGAARSFRCQWSVVAATAARLSVSIDDLAGVPSFARNPLGSDLLLRLVGTLEQALALARQCSASGDPPAGKLRTKSDIAAASATLDQQAADADLLLRSAALLDPAPPAQAPAAAVDSVRAEFRSLVTRIQIGSAASKVAALGSLVALLGEEDDKNAVIAAGEGAVPALVRLLDSTSREARGPAVAAMARIAAVESGRRALAAEGAALLGHLVRSLEAEGGGAVWEKACVVLQALTSARENAMAISFRGGIAALLAICRAGTPSAQAAAAGALKNLAAVEELRPTFLEEGGVPVLIGLLTSGTALAQENSVWCLCNLAAGEEGQSLKLAIFKDGALGCLKNYLEAGGGERRLEPAIGLLRNLASFRYIAEASAAGGFLPYVVSALDSTAAGTRAEAARAVSELAAAGKGRKEMRDAVPRLVRMLEGKAAEEREAAVKALASLMPLTGCRAVFRKEERGVVNVVQLLDPLAQSVDKKYPVAVLASVSQSRKCRKQMVAAGACGYLQRLVDMQVEGAKRLMESLGKGKLLGVFPRT